MTGRFFDHGEECRLDGQVRCVVLSEVLPKPHKGLIASRSGSKRDYWLDSRSRVRVEAHRKPDELQRES